VQDLSVKEEEEEFMLLRNWMTRDPITVEPDTSMMDAEQLMKENKIRCLPVMKGDKLVGIVTEHDVKSASASKATTLDMHELLYLLAKVRVKDIMTKEPTTIRDDDTVEEAAVLMLKHKISRLPVLNHQGDLVGIVTDTDVFKVLVSLTGIYRGGIQFAFELDDRSGSIKEVADIIREHGGQLVGILSSYEDAREGFRKVYIRSREIDHKRLKALEERLQSSFRLIYIIDSRQKKHIFGHE
jgi:acetoin utilization protein AcuB